MGEVEEEKRDLSSGDGQGGLDIMNMLIRQARAQADRDRTGSEGEASVTSAPDTGAAASAGGQAAAAGSSAQTEKKPKSNIAMFLQLFRASELELLICGSQVLDFEAYKHNADYTDGFEAT